MNEETLDIYLSDKNAEDIISCIRDHIMDDKRIFSMYFDIRHKCGNLSAIAEIEIGIDYEPEAGGDNGEVVQINRIRHCECNIIAYDDMSEKYNVIYSKDFFQEKLLSTYWQP